ncbi:DUF3592 domain-containing protein [uncultured Tateyamaria sp.]|uniref:DUF3592 domain-containing protein n=1 Tax=uncultured Tateyamaria sp. TaxID=455651 RepID=UPI00263526FE|nr:DUF3592 domain-containing protein [uncultured Tateyamaria sp.]
MSDLTNGPAPGFWRMLWRTGGMLPLFLAIFTVVMSLISMAELRKGLAFASRGVEVSGEVLDRAEKRVRRDDRWETDYYLTVRYDAQGRVMEKRRKVLKRVYEASDIGSTRRVRYLPEKPETVEFEIGSTLASGKMMRWLSLALGIATLAALWWKGGRAVDAIRARKFGASQWVTVTGIREIKHKNGRSYQLQWTNSDFTTGSSLTAGREATFAPYPPGTKIEVFRGAKGHMWWVGDVGPRNAAATVPSVGKS